LDPSSIGFLILLVVMSGGIAYIADQVGKKLGKKRLSFCGLRPRQTAALGTVLVGVLISCFTIAFALIVSSTMRQSLLQGLKIRQELERDQQELLNLENQLKERTSRNSDLTSLNGELAKKIDSETKSLATRQAELVSAQSKLGLLNTRIGVLQSQISRLTADATVKIKALDDSRKKLAMADSNLARVKADLILNQKSLLSFKKDNNDVIIRNGQLTQARDVLLDAQAKLLSERTKLEKELGQIKVDVANLQSAKELAQAELTKSQTDLGDVQNQLIAAKADLTTTRAELETANQAYAQMEGISNVSRNQPMIFRMDEELVRLSIPAGLSANQANGALTNLMRRARVAAQRRGAKSHASFPEAGIFNHTDRQTGETITTEMIERQILKQVTGSSKAQVLIASSSFNAFRGESVSLEVNVLPNPLVYMDKQLVAESVIDGSKGDVVVYQELTSFLQVKVKEHAQKDGMIPVTNSDFSFGQVSQ
jgi:uncharacterized protein (DUF3084 family)